MTPLEPRDNPTVYVVQLLTPGDGTAGDTAATISGSLAVNSALPTNGSGAALVEAGSAQDAIAQAVVGTVTVQFGGQTSPKPDAVRPPRCGWARSQEASSNSRSRAAAVMADLRVGRYAHRFTASGQPDI